MPRYDAEWLRAHAGPMTPRRMSAVLTGVSAHLGRGPSKLSVTKVSEGRDPFHVLVACLVSLRTRDEVTDVAAPRLLARAPTPRALAALPETEIAALIRPAGFYRQKARTLRRLGAVLERDHGGRVPETLDGLLALGGVGRKTANLVLTLGHGRPGICVDVHVHRISNRLGFARTQAPDDTEQVLRARLPRRWWIPVNDLLVAFGRTVCTPLSPHCSTCPVAELCGRVGVGRHR
jgi:endonuclease-3